MDKSVFTLKELLDRPQGDVAHPEVTIITKERGNNYRF